MFDSNRHEYVAKRPAGANRLRRVFARAVGASLLIAFESCSPASSCEAPSSRSELVGPYCGAPAFSEAINLSTPVELNGFDEVGEDAIASVIGRVLLRAPDKTYFPSGEQEHSVYGDMLSLGKGCDVLKTPREEVEYHSLEMKIFYTSKGHNIDRSRFSDAAQVYLDYQQSYIDLLHELEQAEYSGDFLRINALRSALDRLLHDWDGVGRRDYWEKAFDRFRDLNWKTRGFAISEAYRVYIGFVAEARVNEYVYQPSVPEWQNIALWRQTTDASGSTAFQLEVTIERPWMSDWIILGSCWTWDLPPADARRTLIASGEPDYRGRMPARPEKIILQAKPEDISLAAGTVNRAVVNTVEVRWLPALPAQHLP